MSGGANGPLQGALRAWAERSFPPLRQSSVSLAGQRAHSHHPAKAPQACGARVRSYQAAGEVRDNGSPENRSRGKYSKTPGQSGEQRASGYSPAPGGRGIDGPPEDCPPPKAVERSAGRRRAIDSSPLPHARKRSRHSRPGLRRDTSRERAPRYPAHRLEPRRIRRSASPDSDTDKPLLAGRS